MILHSLYIIIGIAVVLWGADRLTEGASQLARRMNIPEMVIGLTIVAAGTSAPEFFVSLVSALNGTPDLAVGNVVGSNIFNAFFIVGCAAMVSPMVISKPTVKKDIPFGVFASLVLILLCMDHYTSLSLSGNSISRVDGIVLLACFAGFMAYTLNMARSGRMSDAPAVGPEPAARSAGVWRCVLFVAVGLLCLVLGSNLFVSSASAVASQLGVSESVIGLTIVACGTSLPELATSVVAARKGQSAIAIGNVIGSNVFNVLAILGLTAVICPMQIGGITLVDLGVMLAGMLALLLFSFTKYTVARWEGAVLCASFLAYLGWLLYNI